MQMIEETKRDCQNLNDSKLNKTNTQVKIAQMAVFF